MKRREFITGLGSSAVALNPLASRAQQNERMRRVGAMMNLTQSDPEGQALLAVFRQRLRELGWVEGTNIDIEYRWTLGSADRARLVAAELTRLKPDVIFA